MSSHPVQDAGSGLRGTDAAGDAPSDAELLTRVRGGDDGAYGELYERHYAAAVGLARRFARNASDAEDLAAEAFANVLTALKAGSGPESFFRAYLFTALARLAARRNSRDIRQRPVEDIAAFEVPAAYVDPVLESFESRTVAQAYRSLPERWQAVLWYTEVDGMQPAAVAPILGLSANGVSALALRAREGLRQAYLQEHLARSQGKECASYAGKLGAYARNGLSARSRAKVQSHLEECGACTAMLVQLRDVGAGMRAVIFPLVAGAGFAGSAAGSAAVAGAGVGAGAGTTAGAGVGAAAGTTAGAGVGAAGGFGGWLKTAAASTWKWSAVHPAGAGLAAAGAAAAAVVGGALVGGALLPPASSAAERPPGAPAATALSGGGQESSAHSGTAALRPTPSAPAADPSAKAPAKVPAAKVPAGAAPTASPASGLAGTPGVGPLLPTLPGAITLPGQVPPVDAAVPVPGLEVPSVQPTAPALPGTGEGGDDRAGDVRRTGIRISAPQGPARLRVDVTVPAAVRSASIRFTARVDRTRVAEGTPGVPAVSEVLAVETPPGWNCGNVPGATVCSSADAADAARTFIVRVVPLPRVPQILTATVAAEGAAPAAAAAYY
ncbi:sigma-70 family RNA polymerase sigma factor [Paenarthrobacter sp. DKR-5]|uniref:sigma-70 family RNA polymerase sigma factor n=1 Tax=Paenarthrobacter sp. DKR-5 TaxID=2835535 RepID=UPI001BDD88B0|nr:sigma-70 family RNA polymerase sigma factor [Paenarthrobacter sp. DKR-5]MBT1001201.1 sigma-70 family RNA polymerase sigma factor [Paenarthrobacter sp. DKR-5]